MSEEGRLSAEQLEQLAAWINGKAKEKRGGLHPCEICAANNWQILPVVLTPIPYLGNGNISFGTAAPQAFLMCENCGNMKAFNALKMGIVQKKTEVENKEKGEENV